MMTEKPKAYGEAAPKSVRRMNFAARHTGPFKLQSVGLNPAFPPLATPPCFVLFW
jgi:hypothetical protein